MADDDKKKPWIVRQLQYEIRQAEKELKLLKDDNGSETAIREAKDALKELEKKLADLRSDDPGDRREARRDATQDYYEELGGEQGGAWVAALVKQDPELRKLFEEATRKGWDDQEFYQELLKTKWWKDPRRSETWKTAFGLEFGANKDPWNTALKNAETSIKLAASQVGLDLSDMDMDALARRYMYQGWGENGGIGLQQWVSTQIRRNVNNPDPDNPDPYEPGGQAGVTVDDLMQRAKDYGLTYSSGWYARKVAQMTDPLSGVTLDTVILDMVKDARSKYPVWADRLTADYSVRDAAGGYLGAMASILELDDPDSIDLDDPLLQQAWTSVVDEKGNAGVMSLWDFQKLVRKDERWQQTDNAHATYTGAAEEILKMFGFRG